MLKLAKGSGQVFRIELLFPPASLEGELVHSPFSTLITLSCLRKRNRWFESKLFLTRFKLFCGWGNAESLSIYESIYSFRVRLVSIFFLVNSRWGGGGVREVCGGVDQGNYLIGSFFFLSAFVFNPPSSTTPFLSFLRVFSFCHSGKFLFLFARFSSQRSGGAASVPVRLSALRRAAWERTAPTRSQYVVQLLFCDPAEGQNFLFPRGPRLRKSYPLSIGVGWNPMAEMRKHIEPREKVTWSDCGADCLILVRWRYLLDDCTCLGLLWSSNRVKLIGWWRAYVLKLWVFQLAGLIYSFGSCVVRLKLRRKRITTVINGICLRLSTNFIQADAW